MKKQIVNLEFERETKNTVRYQEVGDGPEVLRTIYVQKHVTGNPVPEKIKVTIEAA